MAEPLAFQEFADRIKTCFDLKMSEKMPPQCGPNLVKKRMVSVNAKLPMARIQNRPQRGPVKSEVKAERKRLVERARHPIERVDLPDGQMWGAQIFLPSHVHLGYFRTRQAAWKCYDRALKALNDGTLDQFLEFIGKQRKIGMDVTQIGPPRKKRRYVRQVESKHQKWKREREEGNRRLAEKLAKKRIEILSKRKTIGPEGLVNSPKLQPTTTRSSSEGSIPPLKTEFVTPTDISPAVSPVKTEPIEPKIMPLPKPKPISFTLPTLEKVG